MRLSLKKRMMFIKKRLTLVPNTSKSSLSLINLLLLIIIAQINKNSQICFMKRK